MQRASSSMYCGALIAPAPHGAGGQRCRRPGRDGAGPGPGRPAGVRDVDFCCGEGDPAWPRAARAFPGRVACFARTSAGRTDQGPGASPVAVLPFGFGLRLFCGKRSAGHG